MCIYILYIYIYMYICMYVAVLRMHTGGAKIKERN